MCTKSNRQSCPEFLTSGGQCLQGFLKDIGDLSSVLKTRQLSPSYTVNVFYRKLFPPMVCVYSRQNAYRLIHLDVYHLTDI